METAKRQKRRNEHRQQAAHLQLLCSFTFVVFTLKQCAEQNLDLNYSQKINNNIYA